MRRLLIVVAALLCGVSVSAGDKIDPRLATARKAFVVAVDELGDDQSVAICLADRLHTLTPIEAVKTKEVADVVLRVKAHLTSGASRVLLGSMGGTPSAHLFAELPDGTKLWDNGAKYRRGTGAIGLAADPKCGLANGLLNALRDAMRKARGTQS